MKKNSFLAHTINKGDRKMNFGKPIPLNTQQLPFDVSQAIKKACDICNCELFDKVFRVGIISKFALLNRLDHDITIEYPTYVCRKCEQEFNVKDIKPEEKEREE